VHGPRMLRNELNARLAVNPQPDIFQKDFGHARTHAYYVAEQMSAMNDRVRMLVGGRYTETELSGSRVTKTTPQIGFVVKPFSEDSSFASTSIFVNYSESFTPSGLLQPGTTQVVPPAEGVGREIGIKTAWFGGEVQSTISLFRDDLENIATPDYSNQGQNGAIASYHLGGMGRSEGGEAEIIWTPSPALQVSANYTYMPTAKYLRYPGVPQQEGLRFPSTPEQQWNLSARYEFEDGMLSGLYMGGWVHGQSETRGTLNGDWKYGVRVPDLVQADAFFGYKFKQLDTRLNVKNIGDRGGYVMNNYFLANPPRSVYLSLNYSL
jgi:iron complex outermembrane recepter protein